MWAPRTLSFLTRYLEFSGARSLAHVVEERRRCLEVLQCCVLHSHRRSIPSDLRIFRELDWSYSIHQRDKRKQKSVDARRVGWSGGGDGEGGGNEGVVVWGYYPTWEHCPLSCLG
jgi:hypothetical protein